MRDLAEAHAIAVDLAREEAETSPHRVIASGAMLNALSALCDFDWRAVETRSCEASSRLNALLEQARTARRQARGLE